MSAGVMRHNKAQFPTDPATPTGGQKDPGKSDTAAQDCTTGNCKDCECYCNKDVDDKALSALTNRKTFLGASRADFLTQLNKYFKDNSMNECIVKAHFLAQCAHESGSFGVVEEIRYEMREVKDKEGKVVLDKDKNPVKEPYWLERYDKDDFGGQKYHGRGYIQISSKANYNSYFGHEATDAELASVATEMKHALGGSFWYWKKAWGKDVFSPLAKNNDLTSLTKKLNGGLNGLADRKTKLQSIGKALKISCCKTYKEVWNNGDGIK